MLQNGCTMKPAPVSNERPISNSAALPSTSQHVSPNFGLDVQSQGNWRPTSNCLVRAYWMLFEAEISGFCRLRVGTAVISCGYTSRKFPESRDHRRRHC